MNQDSESINVLITYRWQKLDDELIQRIKDVSPRLNVHYVLDKADEPDLMPSADIIWCIWLPQGIENAPRLKWIQLLSGGYNVIFGSPVESSDIAVTTSSGIHGTPISEFAIAAMVMLSRNLHKAMKVEKPKDLWGDFVFMGQELFGSTVGIIGLGAIGREIARLSRCFGMRVLGVDVRQEPWIMPNDRYIPNEIRESPLSNDDPDLEVRSPAELEWLLDESDFVVITVPLTPGTTGLIGEKEFERMKSSAYLINPARGALVDEPALIRALESNKIAGAALDAFAVEPLPEDSILYKLPNVLITPHMAAHTDKLFERCVDVFCENLMRYLKGEPLLNQVHPPHVT